MEIAVNESVDNSSDNGSVLSHMANQTDKTSGYNPTLVTVVVMLSTFSIVGVIGNAIAFYIFFRRRNSSTSVIFILTLAGLWWLSSKTVLFNGSIGNAACGSLLATSVAFGKALCQFLGTTGNYFTGTDFITCLITIPYTVVFELVGYHLVYDVACKTYMFLITSTVPFSAYIMVGIALDRYFCICHPFLHAVNIARAKVIIFCMGIPALGFGIITALSYGTYAYTPVRLDHNHNGYNITHNGLIPESDLLPFIDKYTKLYHNQYHAERGMARGNLDSDEAAGNDTNPFFSFSNDTADNQNDTSSNETNTTVLLYIAHYGQCVSNNFIFSAEFLRIYQVIHALNFAIAYVAVATLYILIYKAIYTRRAKKAKRRKNNLYLVDSTKEAKCKKETMHTDLHSDNGPSMKLASVKDRRDQVGARKIVPTVKNDLGVGMPSANLAPTEPDEDETANLLSKIDSNGTKASVARRPLALCEKVYDGRDSDEDETDNILLTPISSRAKNNSINNLDLRPGQSEGWPDDGQGSHLIPLLRKDTQSITSGQAANVQVNQDVDKGDAETDKDAAARNSQRNDTSEMVPRTYTFPYPHNDALDVSVTLSSEAPTIPKTGPIVNPPTSLAIKSQHTHGQNANNEAKHKGKHWQTDAHTNSIKRKRPSTVRDRNLMANIKTAIMLFIVILVFLIAFLPALLMANRLIPLHLIVFYGYFIYNVANPFIYAFMNQTFREDLRKILNVCGR